MVDAQLFNTLFNGVCAVGVAVIGYFAARNRSLKVQKGRENRPVAHNVTTGMENVFRAQVRDYLDTGNYGRTQDLRGGEKDLGVGVDDQQLQWMAAEAYHANPGPVPGAAWVPSLSDYEAKVWVVPGSKTAVIAYAGTRPTRFADLWTDARLAAGHLSNSSRVQRSENVLAKVSGALPGYRIITTGHSLGGSLAREVSNDARVDRAVGFNTGYPIDHPMHRLSTRFQVAPRSYHVLHHGNHPKFQDYLNTRDVVSIGAPLQNGTHTYFKKHWEPWKWHEADYYSPNVAKKSKYWG